MILYKYGLNNTTYIKHYAILDDVPHGHSTYKVTVVLTYYCTAQPTKHRTLIICAQYELNARSIPYLQRTSSIEYMWLRNAHFSIEEATLGMLLRCSIIYMQSANMLHNHTKEESYNAWWNYELIRKRSMSSACNRICWILFLPKMVFSRYLHILNLSFCIANRKNIFDIMTARSRYRRQ